MQLTSLRTAADAGHSPAARYRGYARAVPALIEALKDRELFVRQDALWAIGPLCGLKPTSLETLLRITNVDKPRKLYRKSASGGKKTNVTSKTIVPYGSRGRNVVIPRWRTARFHLVA